MSDDQFLTACANTIQQVHGANARAFVISQIARVRTQFPSAAQTWNAIAARLPRN
jgi:hypothetical protein